MAFAILLCASTAAPLQAASNLYWDTDTSGDTWGTGTGTGHTNWSTSSSGGGTLVLFTDGDYAYFTISGKNGGGGVTIGSSGVDTPRITINTGNITFSGGTLTLDDDSVTTPTGYALFNIGSGDDEEFENVIAGSYGILLAQGSGELYLTGANTYTGSNYLQTGTLTIGNNSALGTGVINLEGTGIKADGSTGGAGYTLANAVTLSASTTFGSEGANLAFSGNVNNGGGAKTITVEGITLTFSGNFTGSGALTLAGTSALPGTMVLSGASTSFASMTINSYGTLKLGANNTLPSGTTVNLNGGTLNMNGFNNTVNALQSSGTDLAAGTWGGSGSGATHINSSMTSGTGVLTVSTGGTSTTGTPSSSSNPSTYGTAVTLTATVAGSSGNGSTPSGSVTFYDGGNSLGTGTLSGSGTTATASLTLSSTFSAGTHNITASWPGDNNYDLSSSGTLSQVVNPKALTAQGTLTAPTKIYDGTTTATPGGAAALQAAESTGSGTTSDGKPYSGDTVSLTGTASYAYTSKDVGATVVNESGLSLTGAQAGDYSLTAPSLSGASITAKALTMSGLSVPSSKVYDGTTTATVSGSPGSLQSAETAGNGSTSDGKAYTGDTVSITGTATGTYNSKDVATASSVSFGGLSLTGAQAGDYSLTIQSVASATITAKALTAQGTLTAPTKVYDGTTAATPGGAAALKTAENTGVGTTSDGTPYTGNGDAVSLNGTASYAYSSKDVSATTVTESGLSLTGTGSGDYTLTAPSLSGASITAKALTAQGTLTAPTKVYDGTTTATPGGAAALKTAEATGGSSTTSDGTPYTGNGDAVSLSGTASYAYNSPDVDIATTVTESGLSLTGTGSSDYTLTAPSLSGASITAASSTNVVSSPANPVGSGTNVMFTATLNSLVSSAVPYGTVQFQIDGTPFGSPVTLTTNGTNGVAVSGSTSTLARGYHTNEADYAGGTNIDGDTNIIGSTNTLVELIDTAPVAGLAAYSRPWNLGLIIAISDLLTNATNVYGDPPTDFWLVAVSTNSTNGATIYTNNTYVFYNPPTNNGNVTDSFSYTAADTYSVTAAGTVMVTIQASYNGPSVNITGISTNGNGTVTIGFAGIPEFCYLIQAATNLSPPITWTTLSTNMAGTNGLFQYTDTNASNYSSRYYRTATPQN